MTYYDLTTWLEFWYKRWEVATSSLPGEVTICRQPGIRLYDGDSKVKVWNKISFDKMVIMMMSMKMVNRDGKTGNHSGCEWVHVGADLTQAGRQGGEPDPGSPQGHQGGERRGRTQSILCISPHFVISREVSWEVTRSQCMCLGYLEQLLNMTTVDSHSGELARRLVHVRSVK